MVDIEVRGPKVYFLVENKGKMRARRLGYAKYNFWGYNNIVLTFLRLKRRRFSHHIFFFKFKTLIKMALLLSCLRPKQLRFHLVLTYPKQRRFG